MNAPTIPEQVRQQLQTLGLTFAEAVLDARCDAAAKKELSYLEFLAELLTVELTGRRDQAVTRRLKAAKFPFKRTLNDFDFTFQPSVDKRLVKELGTLSFVADGQNVILLGPPGVGKTHLAVGLGVQAVQQGLSVWFIRAHAIIEDLRHAQLAGQLERRLKVYLKPKLLIIDEFGVWPYDRLASTALFALISARYERNAIILTSNKGFTDWGEVLGDTVVASAILDRLLHHSHVINIRGESYRLREKKRAGLFPSARIGHDEQATVAFQGSQERREQ